MFQNQSPLTRLLTALLAMGQKDGATNMVEAADRLPVRRPDYDVAVQAGRRFLDATRSTLRSGLPPRDAVPEIIDGEVLSVEDTPLAGPYTSYYTDDPNSGFYDPWVRGATRIQVAIPVAYIVICGCGCNRPVQVQGVVVLEF